MRIASGNQSPLEMRASLLSGNAAPVPGCLLADSYRPVIIAEDGSARQSSTGPPLMGGRSVPRFMDLHDGYGGVTREQLKVAQEADWAIEADEGVHFERAWLDPEAGKVFCLSTGPSKEAVMRIHKRAGHPTAEIYELPIEVF
jgi:hypothetical protein